MAKKLSQSKIKRVTLSIIRDYLQNVEGRIKISKVILFGSHARGEQGKYSDIDLIILSPDFKKIEFMDRLVLLSRLRRGMRRSAPMDILGYTSEEFRKLSRESVVLGEAKKEGVVIKHSK